MGDVRKRGRKKSGPWVSASELAVVWRIRRDMTEVLPAGKVMVAGVMLAAAALRMYKTVIIEVSR